MILHHEITAYIHQCHFSVLTKEGASASSLCRGFGVVLLVKAGGEREGHELGFASTLLQDPEGCSENSLSYPNSGFALELHH